MQKASFFIVTALLLILGSCKRECYQCNQYCLSCLNKSDSSFAIEVCAEKYSGQYEIDSLKLVFQDTTHICTFLNNQASVCDGPNKIYNAINYYHQENYYCTQQ